MDGCSYIRASHIGRAIKSGLRKFCEIEPKIKILQYALMPDHLHLILFVTVPIDEILGRVIARFKVMVNDEAGINGVFAKGFNDQILKKPRQLDTLFRYLRENPRRLAVRRAPRVFQTRQQAENRGNVLSGIWQFSTAGKPVQGTGADTPRRYTR